VAVELGRGGGNPDTAFNRIEREADRLNVLVGELIQVTRAEGDPAGISTELLRLDELVRMIVDDVHIEAERHHISLDLDVCEAEMEGNQELLRRAIENIAPAPYTGSRCGISARAFLSKRSRKSSIRSTGWKRTAAVPAAAWGLGSPSPNARSNCTMD